MDDLVAFLCQCLDRDEQLIRQAAEDYFYADGHDDAVNRWFYRWSPDNPDGMLAEVKAKRRILDDYRIAVGAVRQSQRETGVDLDRTNVGQQKLIAARDAFEAAVRAIAGPYAGWPGWREEWAA